MTPTSLHPLSPYGAWIENPEYKGLLARQFV